MKLKGMVDCLDRGKGILKESKEGNGKRHPQNREWARHEHC